MNWYQHYMMLRSCAMLLLKVLIKHTAELSHLGSKILHAFVDALCGLNNYKKNNLPDFNELLHFFSIAQQTYINLVASGILMLTELNKGLGLAWKQEDASVQDTMPLPVMDAKDAHEAFQPLSECIRELCAVNFLDVQLGFTSVGVGKPAVPPDVWEATARLDNREGCLIGGFGQILSPEYCHSCVRCIEEDLVFAKSPSGN